MRLDFVTVDVFTERRFGGNPLAVVLGGAEQLTTPQMQAIASEFNLSETTFVLPPKDRAHTAGVRIFTPKSELPFAGHPNIGTGFVLARRNFGPEPLVFEEKAGLVALELLRDAGEIVGCRLTAPQGLSRGAEIPLDAVAAACGIAADDIETGNHRPCVAGCGISFVLAEVKTRRTLAAAEPHGDLFARHFPNNVGVHLYLRENGEADIRARMFAPLDGVREDPATGSANLALTGLLASLRPEPDLALRLRIAQGVEMGRPSLLEAEADKRGGNITALRIGGRCVPVMSGTIEV
ncbi:MAG TPA: PhzF family phenazine biosynthesis protein [Stellaceae bacterium]|nr:PhzF family phenazine biosynthesis protein [Stellaceae bacterium]